MCGRYLFAENGSGIAERVRRELHRQNISAKTGEVAPGDCAAVIACSRRKEIKLFAMHWGYPLPDGRLIFNARSESAGETPLFSDGLRHRRCLIPADAYFEWWKNGREKLKYRIAPQGETRALLAGLYRLEKGEAQFVILTREPSPSVAMIHNRMPVILPETAAEAWLDPERDGRVQLAGALTEMTAVPLVPEGGGIQCMIGGGI